MRTDARALDAEVWAARCRAHVEALGAADSAHDLAHVERVVTWARRLALAEGADPLVVLPAAWLHDAVVLPKSHPGRPRASSLAAEHARAWLADEGFPADVLPAVAHAVEAHSFSAGVLPRTLEARVVQDADRLDALGAVGLARMYAVAGALGSGLAHPTDPVPSQPPGRVLDDRRWATDHAFTKLLRLPESLYTDAARAEAARRVDTIRAFLAALDREIRPDPAPGAPTGGPSGGVR